MTLYSIFEKPAAKTRLGEGRSAEGPVAIAERFSWFALLLTPLYALRHGLVLLLLFWIVLVMGLFYLAPMIGPDAASGIYWLVALFLGFEAPTLRGDALKTRGWVWRGDVIASAEDIAQRDYLDSVGAAAAR
ncbi:MAG: DUF2628 domain-containing protein [Devosia sp.]